MSSSNNSLSSLGGHSSSDFGESSMAKDNEVGPDKVMLGVMAQLLQNVGKKSKEISRTPMQELGESVWTSDLLIDLVPPPIKDKKKLKRIKKFDKASKSPHKLLKRA
ncbi:hypothetical protein ACSQ67_010263 [Phaseolus vulgaris]